MLLPRDCASGSQLSGTAVQSLPLEATSGSDSFVTYGWRWGGMSGLGSGAQVSWSFAQTNYPGQFGGIFDRFLEGGQQDAVRAALERWEGVSGIDFVEAPADGASVELRFGMMMIDGASGVLGRCDFQYDPDLGSIHQAVVSLDMAENWGYATGAPPAGTISFYTVVLHEIGHALGLAHSEDTSSLMYPSYSASRLDLGADDIEGAAYLYGPSSGSSLESGTGSDPALVAATEGSDALSGTGASDTIAAQGGNDTVNGGDGDDTLFGNQGDDVLFAGMGSDTLYGGQDADLVYGNQDADMLFGNLGADTLFGGQGGDALHGGDGADVVYGNLAADTLHGGLDGDALYGGQGADRIEGEAGDDRLFGNRGDDILVGGAGADIFMFAVGGDADTVLDFEAGLDNIQLASGMTYASGRTADGAVRLDFGNGDGVTLAGITPAEFDPDWLVA